ncbi:MAG: hypothetical protein H5T90_10705 [Acetomicrobium sp.]|nr:hypothetical protein [Acetomicrobium sp.]
MGRRHSAGKNMEPNALSLWRGNSPKSMTQVSHKDVDAKAALLRADKAMIDLLQYHPLSGMTK